MTENHSLGAWIVRRAMRTPDRIALIAAQRRLTYRALGDRVEHVAAGLARQGVRRGHRVVLVLRNEPAMLETTFACGLLGAIAVPLHAELAADALAVQIAQAEPTLIVVTAEAWPQVRRMRGARGGAACFVTGNAPVDARSYDSLVEGRGLSVSPVDVSLDDVGIWGHSSGTSGLSKTVALTHGNLLFNAFNVLSGLDYVSTDVILTSAPLHRMGGWGFTVPILLKGGTCVLQTHANADESLRLIETHRVSVLFDSVPAMEALSCAWERRRTDLSSLRLCLTGGSRVPVALGAAFHSRGLALQPGYGLTEAAPVVAVRDRGDAGRPGNTVGRPALFTSARVVDEAGRDVAPDQPGELVIRGPHVTRGYVGDARANARARMPDGWFRTGDAARMSADGMISVLGRVADALVVGGRRIFPEPIEESLQGVAGVAMGLLVQPSPEADPVLWVVPHDGAVFDATAVGAHVRELMGVVVTPHVRTLDALPRNSNGKPVRQMLRARSAVAGRRQRPGVPLRVGHEVGWSG